MKMMTFNKNNDLSMTLALGGERFESDLQSFGLEAMALNAALAKLHLIILR